MTKQKEPAHHLPEAEAIILASRPELRVHEILLDELAAREVARELKLKISGFAGVLAKAGLEGLLFSSYFL
ncbi:hypothetical protein FJZ31_09690 [Candidatus Poribacteria bacterium]|nr:hypothetical protein [Candidatus Poribacteria bacterium]